MKWDLIALRIRGLEYPKFKGEVFGMCVTILKTEMLETNVSLKDIMAKYKKFIPVKYLQKHHLVIKEKVEKSLRGLDKPEVDARYLR